MSPNDPHRFRAGVGAAIVDRERVLAFRRAGPNGAWQLPQGGIEIGESPDDALWRELREETLLSPEDVRIIARHPVWLGYELPAEARTEKTGRGQAHAWFALAPLRTELSPTVDGAANPNGSELVQSEWMDWDDLIARAIAFRQPVYAALRDWVAQF